jgi:hypothetical protein
MATAATSEADRLPSNRLGDGSAHALDASEERVPGNATLVALMG